MANTPTALSLDGRAIYFEEGDTVLVTAFVMDLEQNLGFPGLVRSGYCSLQYRNQEVRRIDFDRRFGNGEGSEGDFVFSFIHPSFSRDMTVEVYVEAPLPHSQSAGILRKTIPVTLEGKPFIPLEQSPDTGLDANDELRSKKRQQEEL